MESAIIDPNKDLTRSAGGIILPGTDDRIVKPAGIVEATPPPVPPEFKGIGFSLIGETPTRH